jgi:acyl carrier protein
LENNDIYDRIKNVLVKQLDVDTKKIEPESHIMNDLGGDSLQSLEVIMELEEEFDIIIPDDALDRIEKVSDMQKIVGELIVR